MLSLCLVVPSVIAAGCTSTNFGDEQFHLRWATPGKDVMWIPTREHVAVAMLEAAAVGPQDLVYDLGSGDGVIPIVAARRFEAQAVGIEYNPKLVALSQRNAEQAGVAGRVRLKQGDIFAEDFSDATVVTLYLGEQLNLRLEPRLRALRAGTRIVSNTFNLGAWQPDRTIELAEHGRAYLWIVPAQIQGRWRFTGLPGQPPIELSIGQRGQFFDLGLGRAWQRISSEGRLTGDRADFTFPGSDLRIVGRFSEDRFSGTLASQPSVTVSGELIK
jgi:precorrin-6B methylase 2